MQSVIWQLTPRELAAQCIMPRLNPFDYQEKEEHKAEIEALIDQGIGGFCVFQGQADQTALLLDRLNMRSRIPLIFSADYEYGLPMRLEGGTSFPHAMALGQAGVEYTRRAAQIIGTEARTLGIVWNFAPVCDINSNPDNPIINIRAFAENPQQAARHAQAWIKGSQAARIMTSAKHFPGHGDTHTDSHSALPHINRSRAQLEECEFQPFLAAIQAGVDSIMIGHLNIPGLDPTGMPASLSEPIITGIVRNHLQYKGIIVTDALDMHSIAHTYTSGQAALMALKAGATIALVPADALQALEAVAAEAAQNSTFCDMLRQNVMLLAQARYQYGLIPQPVEAVQIAESDGQTIYPVQRHNPQPIDAKTMEKNAIEALEMAKKAIRISDPDTLLPLDQAMHFACFAVLDTDNPKMVDKGVQFFRVLAQTMENECDFGFISTDISMEQAAALGQDTQAADCIIIALFITPRAFHGSINPGENLSAIIGRIAGDKPVIALCMGSPYVHKYIKANAFISACSDSVPSIAAAALSISGRLRPAEWTKADAGHFNGINRDNF
jgi:beta-glucosidase-like glycosyl hydrolase